MTASRVLYMIADPAIREEVGDRSVYMPELEMRARASGVDALPFNAFEGLRKCIVNFCLKKVKLPRQTRSE
jgi:hypothetical protein